MRLPLAIISSKLPMSFVVTACAPHSRASRRAIFCDGVSTSIGAAGRSRATRRAVEPDPVNTITPEIATVWMIEAQAWASASAVVWSGSTSAKLTCWR